jgi:hypothetical protein
MAAGLVKRMTARVGNCTPLQETTDRSRPSNFIDGLRLGSEAHLTKRIFLLSAIMLLLAGVTGCAAGVRTFPAPVTTAEHLRLRDVWLRLQTEMHLDPSRPSWVDDMRWEFEPDGKLRRFYMQVRATEVGRATPAIYQVEGGTGKWQWFKFVDNPQPRRDLPPVGGLFDALDRYGFPGTYLKELQPASFYIMDVQLNSSPPKNAMQRLLDRDSIREWTEADTQRYQGTALPLLRAAAMVPMAAQSPNTKAYQAAGQVYYAVPEAAAR